MYRCLGLERFDEETGLPVCDYENVTPWKGRCPKCDRVYGKRRFGVAVVSKKAMTTASEVADVVYIPTGIEGFDKVSGGGLVAGCVVLFGGEEGAGKTTLSMMIADGVAKTRPVVYASAEQSAEEVVRIAKRVGVQNERIKIMGNASNVYDVIEFCKEVRPVLAIFDSIQMMNMGDGPVGSSSQGEQVANVIRGHCKKTGMSGIAVNQLSSSGFFKGSKMIGHMVDTLMYLDKMFPLADQEIDKEKIRGLIGYENARGLRELISGKNRNAVENSKAYLEMGSDGRLRAVRKKSRIEAV